MEHPYDVGADVSLTNRIRELNYTSERYQEPGRILKRIGLSDGGPLVGKLGLEKVGLRELFDEIFGKEENESS